MNTTRILKVLALAMEANPNLPIPLTLDNIDLDDIIATPNGPRNTAATMYARDTGQIVRYIGSSGVVYDRIDIAKYWRTDTIVESRTATTVGDLATILRSQHGLDVLSSEIKNASTLLPDSGTVRIEIDDTVSPLYLGYVDVDFAKDAGLRGKDGLEYVLGNIINNSQPILGYASNTTDVIEVSVNHGSWQRITPVRSDENLFAIYAPSPLIGPTANIRIRGTKPALMNYENEYVPITKLITYKSFTEAVGFFSGILSLVEVAPDAFKFRPELLTADYLFDGCLNLAILPDHLLSPCLKLRSAKAAFRKTGITVIPVTLLESCSQLTDVSMMFEQCTRLQRIPGRLFSSNTALLTVSRCFMGTTGVTDEIPQGLLDTLVKVEDASFLFAGNPWVSTLPPNLLSKCTALKDVSGMFSRCVNLAIIPSDLLSGLYVLRTVSRLFEGCTKIASIPPGLFISNIDLEYMEYTFASTGILTTPAVMFTYVRRLLSIDYVFSNCVKLNAIPNGLLSPLLRLQSANGVWMNCIGITSIPTGILDGNANVLSLAWLFANIRTTTIPSGLLSKVVKVTDISGMFSGTRITTVPADLLSTLTALRKVDRLFWKCASLTTIPSGLFQQNVKLESVVGLFAYCTALSASITAWFNATTAVTSANIKNCSGCFQGVSGLAGSLASLRAVLTGVDWNDSTSTQGVVAGCTALTDYASIGSVFKTPLAGLV